MHYAFFFVHYWLSIQRNQLLTFISFLKPFIPLKVIFLAEMQGIQKNCMENTSSMQTRYALLDVEEDVNFQKISVDLMEISPEITKSFFGSFRGLKSPKFGDFRHRIWVKACLALSGI